MGGGGGRIKNFNMPVSVIAQADMKFPPVLVSPTAAKRVRKFDVHFRLEDAASLTGEKSWWLLPKSSRLLGRNCLSLIESV
jgi:hypothetical protein